ncbi:hypothetical protein SOVF_176110 [Spinacia oleracea]|nr:hypothetical protein SOVF_176110 [Spinacia oleracea]
MGNANGREEEGIVGGNINIGNVHDYLTTNTNSVVVGRITSSDSMAGNSPPDSPPRSASPLMFTPQTAEARILTSKGAEDHYITDQ